MINSLYYVGISCLLPLNILLIIGISFAIRQKNNMLVLMAIPMLLLCLIALTFMITQLMIDDSILIQVDATVIAGLLILLSITQIWRSKSDKKLRPITTVIRKWGLYLTPNGIFFSVVPFGLSATVALINSGNNDFLRFFSLLCAGLGFALLMLIACIVAFGEKKEDLDLS